MPTRDIEAIKQEIVSASKEAEEAYNQWKKTGDRKYYEQEDAAEKRRIALSEELARAIDETHGISPERREQLDAMQHCAEIKVSPHTISWGGRLTIREIDRRSTSRTSSQIYIKLDGLNVETDKTEQMFLYFTDEQAQQIVEAFKRQLSK